MIVRPCESTVTRYLKLLDHPVVLIGADPVDPDRPRNHFTTVWPREQYGDPAGVACCLSEEYHRVTCNLNSLRSEMLNAVPPPWNSLSDAMIDSIDRVLIDVDCHRGQDKDEALRQMLDIRDRLGEPVFSADTGNGFAMHYKCDLPHTDASKQKVKRFLADLKQKFPLVDSGVWTTSRQTRVIGTLNRDKVNGSRILSKFLDC